MQYVYEKKKKENWGHHKGTVKQNLTGSQGIAKCSYIYSEMDIRIFANFPFSLWGKKKNNK